MARLWNYFGGEPFLDNPHLAIVSNPTKGRTRMAKRKRPMPAALKRYWATHSRKKKNRPRRNAIPIGGVAVPTIMNKPKRYKRRAKHNPPARRRHYRRNPAILGVELPQMATVLYAGAGFIVPPMLEGILMRYVPTDFATSTVGKYTVRIASVLGLTFLAKQLLGSQEAKYVAIGGGAYVLTTAIGEFAPTLLHPQLSAYTSATRGLGAFTASTRKQLGAPPFGAMRTPGVIAAPQGGMNVIPSRFRRFQ